MYTQCPECKKKHKITIDELSDSRGMICCDECSAMFDALELLSEGQDAIEASDILTIPEIKSRKKHTPLWGLGYSVCIILFIFLLRLNITNPATKGIIVNIKKNPENPTNCLAE